MCVGLISTEALNSALSCVNITFNMFLSGRRDLEQGIDEKRADEYLGFFPSFCFFMN